jgi:RNA polymerase sigma-70 factor (ECF subfamily)
VYNDHVWRVYGFFVYRLADRDAAEDLTQMTFEHGLRAWARFDARRGSETTWLLAIARNLLIDHYRRDRSGHQAQLDEQAAWGVTDPVERYVASPEMLTALSQLSDRDRSVIALRYGGDLAGPEIAVILGLTLANVQQILSRSLRKLRVELEPQQVPRPAHH